MKKCFADHVSVEATQGVRSYIGVIVGSAVVMLFELTGIISVPFADNSCRPTAALSRAPNMLCRIKKMLVNKIK